MLDQGIFPLPMDISHFTNGKTGRRSGEPWIRRHLTLELKPTHEVVEVYHENLAKFAKLGIELETAGRSGFQEQENRSWGYRRMVGALSNLRHETSHQTVANILKRDGLAPAPEIGKKTLWQDFIRSHEQPDLVSARQRTASGSGRGHSSMNLRPSAIRISPVRSPRLVCET